MSKSAFVTGLMSPTVFGRKICDDGSVDSNENENWPPACKSFVDAAATHWMPNPSLGVLCVMWSVQPVGAVTLVGCVIRKLVSGWSSHANQNVPIVEVVEVFVSVMVYWNSPPNS